jgi:hypothetical protein
MEYLTHETREIEGHVCIVLKLSSFESPTKTFLEVTTRFNGRDTVVGNGYTVEAALESARRGITSLFREVK